MKKYLWLLIVICCCYWTSVFATYDDFSQQLETIGVDAKEISTQENVSRYDVARLLNIVECNDCIHPAQSMIDTYTQNFWSNFIIASGSDFSDIQFKGGIYNTSSYFYCVAYVGDKTYMRWYPKATSPICGGKFCGTQPTTTAEFIQVVINIIAKYIYKDISINRDQVYTWRKNLKADSYEARNFTSQDTQYITQKSKWCAGTCALENANEVNLYLKYCMFNVSKCSMKEFGKIKQGYRPVAEINMLEKQNIIDVTQLIWTNTDKAIDGKTVIETLYKVYGKIQCTFNNDYDCDGLNNTNDSCPNEYNPQQHDTDQDQIGDVCDEDIDGDGSTNPIGIVDDEGNIIIGKRTGSVDNCLFVVNTGQNDSNNNGIGNLCDHMQGNIGITIKIENINGPAPISPTFTAITAWATKAIMRNFGDGEIATGKTVTHTFTTPGIYNVQARTSNETQDAKASIVVVAGGSDDAINKALQSKVTAIWGKNNMESTITPTYIGEIDEIVWSFPAEKISITKSPKENINRIFKISGENPIILKAYNKGIVVSINYFTIGIDKGRWAILKSNILNPDVHQKILFDTTTYNIRQKDIMNVERNFGDTTIKNNTALTTEYAYQKAGKKVITQKITFIDGKEISNMITITIRDSSQWESYALMTIPSTLTANQGQTINFESQIVGSQGQTPIIHIMEFSDGMTEQKWGTQQMPFTYLHRYQTFGKMTPQTTTYINQCRYVHNQSTISIDGNDQCLVNKLQGNLKTAYTCDMDKDGIPDICDEDIDGDGIKNLIGIIRSETNDCSYTNNDNIFNPSLLAKHFKGICSLDNAPLIRNPDQWDLNKDNKGDVQTYTGIYQEDKKDTDGDSIEDNKDLCPNIQETWNGIQDNDGCPEIGQDVNCSPQDTIAFTTDNLIVKATQCNQCPCQFTDIASDLTINDQVRAILWDNKKTIPYKFSLPWIVDIY